MKGNILLLLTALLALLGCTDGNISLYSAKESPVSSGCGVPEIPLRDKDEIKVLYIGNSQLQVNECHKIIMELSREAPNTVPLIEFDTVYVGGETLKGHWQSGAAAEMIRKNGYEYVVLQGFYSSTKEELVYYGKLFCELARDYGATPIIFSYSTGWEWGSRELHDKHQALLNEVKWARPALTNPVYKKYCAATGTARNTLDQGDGHPNFKGSYIYALTIFMAITGHSPVGLGYVPEGSVVSPEQYQQAALEAYKELNLK